jgi:hypothetical protein
MKSFFDPERVAWREVVGDAELPYKVRHEYTILGHNVAAGTLDMVLRWEGDGGHCLMHRHVCTTSVLVLAGEQHTWDLNPDGSRGKHTVRQAGEYALNLGDGPPHLERGGDDGAIVFFGGHNAAGILYELVAPDMTAIAEVTIEGLVQDWKAHT